MAKLNPFKFLQEVRQETNKVTWPSRRETAITTAMVFIFAAVAAVFFLLADQLIRIVVTLVLRWDLRRTMPMREMIKGAGQWRMQ